MKKNQNKKPISNTVDALLNDYKNNKETYNNIINSKSISHQYFEGIYLKYSKSLENYMKKNQKSLKLIGSKKFMNVPIDIFLKESKLYKEEILNDLKNKSLKTKNSINLDKIFLTPLPSKPRVLLNTEKEKNDFLFAERQAVVMRTFEYTNALRNKGLNQYYQMKENEKQEMIYIMKKASNIILNWWNSIKGKIRFEKKIKKRNYNFQNLIEKFILKKKKKLFWYIINKMLEYKKIKNYQNMRIYNFKFSFISKKKNIKHKIKNQKWEYFIRKKYYVNNIFKNKRQNSNLTLYNKNPFISKIIFIQRNFRELKKKKEMIKKEKRIKLNNIIKTKKLNEKIYLTKYLLKWLKIIHNYSTKRKIFSNALNNKLKGKNVFIPTYLSYLPIILLLKFKSRFQNFFDLLKERKNKIIKLEKINVILKKILLKNMMKKLRVFSKKNILIKLINKIDKKGKKWKYFQFWNLRNLLIHIFVSKLIKFAFSFSKYIFFENVTMFATKPPFKYSKNINGQVNNQNKQFQFYYKKNNHNQNINFNNSNFIYQNINQNLQSNNNANDKNNQ